MLRMGVASATGPPADTLISTTSPAYGETTASCSERSPVAAAICRLRFAISRRAVASSAAVPVCNSNACASSCFSWAARSAACPFSSMSVCRAEMTCSFMTRPRAKSCSIAGMRSAARRDCSASSTIERSRLARWRDSASRRSFVSSRFSLISCWCFASTSCSSSLMPRKRSVSSGWAIVATTWLASTCCPTVTSIERTMPDPRDTTFSTPPVPATMPVPLAVVGRSAVIAHTAAATHRSRMPASAAQAPPIEIVTT